MTLDLTMAMDISSDLGNVPEARPDHPSSPLHSSIAGFEQNRTTSEMQPPRPALQVLQPNPLMRSHTDDQSLQSFGADSEERHAAHTVSAPLLSIDGDPKPTNSKQRTKSTPSLNKWYLSTPDKVDDTGHPLKGRPMRPSSFEKRDGTTNQATVRQQQQQQQQPQQHHSFPAPSTHVAPLISTMGPLRGDQKATAALRAKSWDSTLRVNVSQGGLHHPPAGMRTPSSIDPRSPLPLTHSGFPFASAAYENSSMEQQLRNKAPVDIRISDDQQHPANLALFGKDNHYQPLLSPGLYASFTNASLESPVSPHLPSSLNLNTNAPESSVDVDSLLLKTPESLQSYDFPAFPSLKSRKTMSNLKSAGDAELNQKSPTLKRAASATDLKKFKCSECSL